MALTYHMQSYLSKIPHKFEKLVHDFGVLPFDSTYYSNPSSAQAPW